MSKPKNTMTLAQLKDKVDSAIEYAEGCGELPDEIVVSIQIDKGCESVSSCNEVELHYDNNGMASGCVLTAFIG